MFIDIFERFLMGFSLSVHIILAAIGIALPLIILICEYMSKRYKDKAYTIMARRLTTIFLITFAVGTASGTIVALELLFLWPKFMALVSQVAILPVLSEVFVFFGEAIFLAIYIYFRDKLSNPYAPMAILLIIAVCAASSGAFITMLNAFMNTPVGFNITAYLQNGTVTGVNPLAVFDSPSSSLEIAHVLVTSYFTGTFIFLGYFALMLLGSRSEKEKDYYRKGIRIMFCVVTVATFLALITGSMSITQLLAQQPEKYAAIELNLAPQSHAPEIIGGIYYNGSIHDYIAIPNLQSILATGSANGTVPGLSSFPQSTWPPLFIHLLFDLLVFLGFAIGLFLIIVALLELARMKPFENRIMLSLLILCSVLSVVLVESGWVMAEVGRQPWIIYNVMTVTAASNYSSGILPIAALFLLFYILIIPFTLIVLRRLFSKRPLETELVSKNEPPVF